VILNTKFKYRYKIASAVYITFILNYNSIPVVPVHSRVIGRPEPHLNYPEPKLESLKNVAALERCY
jgi:hypothetical protein